MDHQAAGRLRLPTSTPQAEREIIFGDPLQRALRNPTKIALIAAVDAVLGENASPQARQRALDIMGMFWTSDLEIGGTGNTLTEALQGIVARAIDRPNA